MVKHLMKMITVTAFFASSSAFALTPWQKIDHPIIDTPQAIGSFTNGCIVGAKQLPLHSPHYQVMRPDQRRYFGHPDLLAFIHRLSGQAQQQGVRHGIDR